jgi:tetratricopeptide (TPR) repeat protein
LSRSGFASAEGKTSAEAFYLMANAYMGLEAYKTAAQSCDNAAQFAGDNVELQAQAYNLKGVALQKQADVKDIKKLQEAEAALRQAISVKSDFSDAYYNLGFVLMQQNRDPEGTAELKKFLEMAPHDSKTEIARKLIDNPRRAREPFAPEFSLTTAEGEYISLDELKGKVVLLDFWGTWCGGAWLRMPALRDANQEICEESGFVMIGVSSDGDEDNGKHLRPKKDGLAAYLIGIMRYSEHLRCALFPSYRSRGRDPIPRRRRQFRERGQPH